MKNRRPKMSLNKDAPQPMTSTKAPKRSFEEMFGKNDCAIDADDCGIDFTEKLPDITTFLSTSEPTDKLVQTYRKLEKLAELVTEGKSLAIHTNYAKAPQKELDPIAEAMKKMRSIEIEQYNAWLAGAVMPTVDWKNSHKTVMLSKDEKAHFQQQVRAIREIYQNPRISRTNAHWFISNLRYVLPLIEAVAIVRVVRQEYVRDEEDPTEMELAEQEGLTKMELAELETARGIIGVTTDILQKRERRVELDPTLQEKHLALEWVMDLAREACGIIQFRVSAIHEKAVRYKERKNGMGVSRAKE